MSRNAVCNRRLWIALAVLVPQVVLGLDPPVLSPGCGRWARWVSWAGEEGFSQIIDDIKGETAVSIQNVDARFMRVLALVGAGRSDEASQRVLAEFDRPDQEWSCSAEERQLLWFSALVCEDLGRLLVVGPKRATEEYARCLGGVGWVRVDVDEIRQILGVRAGAGGDLEVSLEGNQVRPLSVRIPASTAGVERLPYWTGEAKITGSVVGGERKVGAEVKVPAPGGADAVAKFGPWPPIGIRYDAGAGIVHWTLEGTYAGKSFELWIQLHEKHRIVLRKPVSASGSATVESLKEAARQAAGPIRNAPVFDPGSGIAYDIILMPAVGNALTGTMITIGAPTSGPSATEK